MSIEVNELAADLAIMAASIVDDAKEVTEANVKQLTELMRADVAVDSGATRDSIDYEVTVRDGIVSGEAGPSTDYADKIEYGTVNMAPQPYALPAADKQAPTYEAELGEAALKRWG